MSYILDALKRANSQRELGEVPNLYAQTSPRGQAHNAPRTARTITVLALAALVIALIAIPAVWWALKPATELPKGLGSAAALTTQTDPSGTGDANKLFKGAPTPTGLPKPSTVSDANNYPQPVVLETAPTAGPRVTPLKAEPATSSAQKAEAKVPMLSQLAADLRQGVPALNIGGIIFSNNPSQRLVILNGQLTQEGQKVTPDLSLERIHAKSVELSFRGTRFEVQAP